MDKQLRQRVSLLKPDHFLGLGFGSGLIPFMPGTWGSLAAVPLLIAMSFLPEVGYLAVTVFCCVIGVRFCQKTSDALGLHDHGSIVWDEIAGMMVVFIALPITPLTLLLGFLLFRFFDILKPWPIRVLDQKVHGGFGIMIDDIIAGALACLCLHLIVSTGYLPLF
ncbi:phosphatidylglycerophosphatase A [Glaciecola sp. XM2]|uniref:phosphatidylglycerophosphatase A family protein n=1 Tax=Glaciecola sp. XM2 TaxID=1914931 RepID=UPI001BDECEC6|nr:phosphatidylglycerophosphatase A [Glaciecola sp. XM2]MBT1452294.1 phosphatidylglycerophosphatase A [Glaciecola sp. XM2]